MALQGLDAAKYILISLVVFAMGFGALLLVQEDIGDEPFVNKTIDPRFNQTQTSINQIQSLSENMTDLVLDKQNSDTNALQTMLAAGYSTLRMFYSSINLITNVITEIGLILGIPTIIIIGILTVLVIIFLFIILKAIFGAGGGSI